MFGTSQVPGRLALPLVLAGTLALAGGVTAYAVGGDDGGARGASSLSAAAPVRADDLTGTVTALQARLRTLPTDYRSWATLALAYVEQARVTTDSSYYPKADQALERAVAGAPADDLVLTARAALAAARHDFADALSLADQALAVNAYSALASAVRADALTELGRYDEALEAANRADAVQPGTSTFSRLSYAQELRGNIDAAKDLMERAAVAASAPADVAFARFQLGELFRNSGDVAGARTQYDLALRALPDHAPALAGNAKLLVSEGRTAEAVAAYTDVVARLPLPAYLTELGELHESLGQQELAQRQYDVVRAGQQISAANGVDVDLEGAVFEADHGDAAVALAQARKEYAKRPQSIAAADALAWALHANGADDEALRYAREATRLGTPDARYLFHRGMIEKGAGETAAAVASLKLALSIDPHFSPLQAPLARRTLAELGGAS